MYMYNPDFDLYDNAGRTTEQSHAYNTNSPTSDDLHRWAAHDAQEFTDSLAMAAAGQSITAWTDQIPNARSAAEFQAVTEAVLSHEHGALGALHQFLESAAEWCDRNEEPDIARRYRARASRLAELGDQLAYLGEDHLAHTYSPTSAAAPTAPTSTACAPPPPTTGTPLRRPPR
ncbi:hypothetical protein ACIRQP_35035 [Streptomyces sp. NPDC102274]|uniref:hypothetical protein n=1 Tax=Streptomyces sp. NPDC102274 TaxID=3366151 RepID=UPI00380A5629